MLELLLLLETPEDKSSFQELYENIYRRLLYVALGILHKQQDAEDIVHDVFEKIAKDYPKYRNKSEREMLSLGVVMTRNASINIVRARKRHQEIVLEAKDELLWKGKDPLQDILLTEDIAVVERALLKMKAEDRDILVLKYYHEMSYKEMGHVLGIKPKAVDMRLYRAKKRLREVLLHEQ